MQQRQTLNVSQRLQHMSGHWHVLAASKLSPHGAVSVRMSHREGPITAMDQPPTNFGISKEVLHTGGGRHNSCTRAPATARRGSSLQPSAFGLSINFNSNEYSSLSRNGLVDKFVHDGCSRLSMLCRRRQQHLQYKRSCKSHTRLCEAMMAITHFRLENLLWE